MIALNQRYHLQRWIFEKCCTISVKAPEMMTWKPYIHHPEMNLLKKASPSPRDAILKNRLSSPWRWWQWIYVTISMEMIPCFSFISFFFKKKQHLHLRDDSLFFKIASPEMVTGDSPHFSILFHTWYFGRGIMGSWERFLLTGKLGNWNFIIIYKLGNENPVYGEINWELGKWQCILAII